MKRVVSLPTFYKCQFLYMSITYSLKIKNHIHGKNVIFMTQKNTVPSSTA